MSDGILGVKSLTPSVLATLTPFVSEQSDDRLLSLLALSVGRILQKEVNQRGGLPELDLQAIAHISDWLKSALVNDACWLYNTDQLKRPKKLMKFGSIKQMLKEADKAMLIAAQQSGGVSINESDEKLFATLDDGYNVVRMLTPEALDRESAEMQHCIGNGGYDNRLSDKNYLFLSLRDRLGKSHATIEVKSGVVCQLRGKQNKRPIQRYLDRAIQFIKIAGYAVDVPVYTLRHIIDENGKWHNIDALPKGITVRGDLDFRPEERYEELPVTLPEGLTVHGNLKLSWSTIAELPKDLEVFGNVDLRLSRINSIGENANIHGYLDARRTPLKSLPKGLAVGSYLYIEGDQITTLPENLYVGGNLNIEGNMIVEKPLGLVVEGDVNHRGLSYSPEQFMKLFDKPNFRKIVIDDFKHSFAQNNFAIKR